MPVPRSVPTPRSSPRRQRGPSGRIGDWCRVRVGVVRDRSGVGTVDRLWGPTGSPTRRRVTGLPLPGRYWTGNRCDPQTLLDPPLYESLYWAERDGTPSGCGRVYVSIRDRLFLESPSFLPGSRDGETVRS